MADLPCRQPHVARPCSCAEGPAYIDFCQGGSIPAFLTLVAVGKPCGEVLYRMRHWVSPGAWDRKLIVLQLSGDEFARPLETLHDFSYVPDGKDQLFAAMLLGMIPRAGIS
jgi:hypothetical protein